MGTPEREKQKEPSGVVPDGMTPKARKAYEEALRRIEVWRRNVKGGLLDLNDLGLSMLPPEIGQLGKLGLLWAVDNQLKMLPPEIGQLTAVKQIRLSGNQLTTLPREIAQLTALEQLYLTENQLATLPPEIGRLTALTHLSLYGNQLTTLPPEIGQLTSLHVLDLRRNQLKALPPEIGQLTSLQVLQLDGNPLVDPPLAVCEQGIEAIGRYFEEKDRSGSTVLWRSKLLLVGQGRVGKTELRNRLMGRPHGQAKSTEVLEIEPVKLPHPRQDVTMELSCWDFGGQDIYHATHQFFLTGRSLFVFCFEAGKDWEAGKPYYWLDKIAAVAPDAPVVIVATKGDERPAPALPWAELKKRYPQLVGEGPFTVTTKAKERKDSPGDGLAELTACLQAVAADKEKLPLMGQEMPLAWVRAMKAVTEHPHDHYLEREVFHGLLMDAGVAEDAVQTVAVLLRDLGEILYYWEERDAALRPWVIIKPTWVTRAAGRLLDCPKEQIKDGVLTHKEMWKAWEDYPPQMHKVLLDLMEKYDLTYKIPEDDEHRSLVVERLPKEPVAPPDEWEALKPSAAGGVREMQMTLELQSMQAGIPSWFIARKHYHTLRRHWLHGVYFADDRKAPRHVALVRTPPDQQPPRVELTVRGPFPQTFFAVMKDGLEASIRDRYPELIKAQKIPCCCQDGKPGAEPCPHLFNYERLLERLAKGKKSAECDVSQEDVSVAELLFGYDDPGGSLEKQLREATDEILAKLDDVAADVRQNFRLLYDDLQQREESACPNLFVIWKAERGKPFHVPMRMALLCQHPGEEHINCKPEEAYHIDALKDYLRKAAPLLKGVATVLRYAKLTGLPFAREWHEEIQDAVDNVQDTLKEMLEDFEEVAEKGEAPELLAPEIDGRLGANRQKRVAGAALREFRALLDKVDETRRWHGLVKRKWNQTGEYLWVCERHAAQADYK